jgi:hypothetical protein
MTYKILTLLIFIILFPALIAGSTLLLHKFGVVNLSKPDTDKITTQQTTNPSTKISNQTQTNEINEIDSISVAESFKPFYFTGKIDGKFPFHMVLNKFEGMGMSHSYLNGQLVYDNISEYPLNVSIFFSGSPADECQKDNKAYSCYFYMKEFDDGNIPLKHTTDDLKYTSEFEGRTTLEYNPSKITGTWTKADKSQKLKFELSKSEEYEIEEYLVKYNEDKSIYIDGQCVLGHKFNAKCNLYNSITKTKIIELASCEDTEFSCFSSIYFGKKINNEQYIFIENTLAPSHSIELYKFNISEPDLELVDSFSWGDSLENLPLTKYPTKGYKAFLEAQQKYSLPKP